MLSQVATTTLVAQPPHPCFLSALLRREASEDNAPTRLFAALALGFTAFLGLAHLPAPFTGDQALYMLGGRSLLEGKTLYVDFWDIKHPGVHLFYALSQRFFGFSEVALHAFELLYLLALGVLLQVVLRSRLKHAWLASFAPITTVGAYYLVIDPWMLTQVELLAGPVVFGVALLTCVPKVSQQTERFVRFFSAGLAGAVVILFLGPMAPIPIAMIVMGALTLRSPAALLFGALGLALGLFVILLWAGEGRSALLDVYWSYPLEAGRYAPAQPRGCARVAPGLRWFASRFAPWILLAGASVLAPTKLRRARLAWMMLLWGALGLLILTLESRPSWPFHFLFFVIPVGVLSVYGLDAALSARPWRRPRTIVALLLAFAMARWLPHWSRQASPLVAHLARGLDLEAYRRTLSPDYREAEAAAALLSSPSAKRGPIYVFGDPLLILKSDRRQAISRNGWGWEVYLPEHWAQLPATLHAGRPAYIFVGRAYTKMIEARSPETSKLLDERYEVHARRSSGVWYQRRD